MKITPMTTYRAVAAIALAGCILIVNACASEQDASPSDEGLFALDNPTIETETVFPAPLATMVTATGQLIIPEDQVAVIGPLLEARLVRFHVGQGSRVRKGQHLADLESADVDAAKADYLRAIAELENARRVSETETKLAESTYDRIKLLYERTITARKNLLAAETDLEVARSNAANSMASARAGLQTARRTLQILGVTAAQIDTFSTAPDAKATFSLISPIDGTVVERNATIGATVGAGSDVFRIIDPSPLWIDANVFEKDVALVTLGQTVNITVPAYPGLELWGKVIFISSEVDPETRTVNVRTQVSNADGKLKVGMFANIGVQVESRPEALAVPRSAVLSDGDEHVVFVAAATGYEKRVVALGITSDDRVEIRAGLAAGDKVVVKGNYLLLEQSRFGSASQTAPSR